jgi:hypothetical protein
VGEHQHLAGGEVRRDLGLVEAGLHVSGASIMMTSAHCRGLATESTTVRPAAFGLGAATCCPREADAHLDAALAQVEGVGVALRAVADDRDLLAADEREVASLS